MEPADSIPYPRQQQYTFPPTYSSTSQLDPKFQESQLRGAPVPIDSGIGDHNSYALPLLVTRPQILYPPLHTTTTSRTQSNSMSSTWLPSRAGQMPPPSSPYPLITGLLTPNPPPHTSNPVRTMGGQGMRYWDYGNSGSPVASPSSVPEGRNKFADVPDNFEVPQGESVGEYDGSESGDLLNSGRKVAHIVFPEQEDASSISSQFGSKRQRIDLLAQESDKLSSLPDSPPLLPSKLSSIAPTYSYAIAQGVPATATHAFPFAAQSTYAFLPTQSSATLSSYQPQIASLPPLPQLFPSAALSPMSGSSPAYSHPFRLVPPPNYAMPLPTALPPLSRMLAQSNASSAPTNNLTTASGVPPSMFSPAASSTAPSYTSLSPVHYDVSSYPSTLPPSHCDSRGGSSDERSSPHHTPFGSPSDNESALAECVEEYSNARYQTAPPLVLDEAVVKKLQDSIENTSNLYKKLARKSFQIHVTVLGFSTVVIQRTIVLPAAMQFHKIHKILQIVLGWQSTLPHMFITSGGVMIAKSSKAARPSLNEQKVRLANIVTDVGDEFFYKYGKHWMHRLRVEAIGAPRRNIPNTRVIRGVGQCPQDNCDGPESYEALARAGMAEVAPFSLDAINLQLMNGQTFYMRLPSNTTKQEEESVCLRAMRTPVNILTKVEGDQGA